MDYEAIIGLEIHAELATQTKMFCRCSVIDVTNSGPNSSVCPICSGMPGVLPVINEKAVEYGLKVALALNCEIAPTSVFARKNYFYPDLPKGYQISQYEQPLARHGHLTFDTHSCAKTINIRRIHLEEDTGKLTHAASTGESNTENARTLVDLNRAGVPLLEIVTEPELKFAEDVRLFAMSLRSILRYLKVNSGDMQKGVIRIEPNVSVRSQGTSDFGTRTEIKNLNSFRALERSVDYEINRQIARLLDGKEIIQETRGWDEVLEQTFTQRKKEEEDDYRYFPEPDLPPVTIPPEWISEIKSRLPELPRNRARRFKEQYSLSSYDVNVLTDDPGIADYFESILQSNHAVDPKEASNWVTGDLFNQMNKTNLKIQNVKVKPDALADLILMVQNEKINLKTGKYVFSQMYASGNSASDIVDRENLSMITDVSVISDLISDVIEKNPEQLKNYLAGKDTLFNWFFGQVMAKSQGKVDPQLLRNKLNKQLNEIKRIS